MRPRREVELQGLVRCYFFERSTPASVDTDGLYGFPWFGVGLSYILLWCNGSTTDFDSVGCGSNP